MSNYATLPGWIRWRAVEGVSWHQPQVFTLTCTHVHVRTCTTHKYVPHAQITCAHSDTIHAKAKETRALVICGIMSLAKGRIIRTEAWWVTSTWPLYGSPRNPFYSVNPTDRSTESHDTPSETFLTSQCWGYAANTCVGAKKMFSKTLVWFRSI